MSRKPAARSRPGKAEVERKRDERATRRALARERRNRAQGEGEHDDGGGGLNEQLRALGLRLREVPGDGNCLFRALGDQLEGHSRNHLKHRQDTVAYMIQQRADFEPFVEDDVPFEKHIANLAQPGTFAGNDAIVAFARNNQVNIVIHQQNAPLWQIHGTDKSNARELHIAYRYGEHYDSVRKINDNSAAPARLQTEDVGLIAQVLEAEGYSIESAIFAIFQMKELEKLHAEEDQANRPAPWDEKGSRGRTLGLQEVEKNNIPRGNLVERNRSGQKECGGLLARSSLAAFLSTSHPALPVGPPVCRDRALLVSFEHSHSGSKACRRLSLNTRTQPHAVTRVIFPDSLSRAGVQQAEEGASAAGEEETSGGKAPAESPGWQGQPLRQ